MRIASVRGRATVLTEENAGVDVARASAGRFGPDMGSIYLHWVDFAAWAADVDATDSEPFSDADLGLVVEPSQVFAVAMNYGAHAREIGIPLPEDPAVFTKFRSCLAAPYADVHIPSDNCDFEVELVAVIGVRADHVPPEQGWDHVAGLTIGQDISERVLQNAGPMPQFSLAKSFPSFGPLGPCLVTSDEFVDPDDLELSCLLDGQVVQRARTSDLIFPIPELVARLSRILPLLPGDVIFTGTPAGVGAGRNPPRFLRSGDTLVSRIEGIGELRQKVVTARTREFSPI